MHRLVRIEGLHDFRVDNPLKFVLYDGSNYIKLQGEITSSNYIRFTAHDISTKKLFEGFGITNIDARLSYCKKHDPDCTAGIFSYHSSLSALNRILRSFFDLNQHIKIPSMYNVGDQVRIKSKYDVGSESSDYPSGFTNMMLDNGKNNKVYTIKQVTPDHQYYKKHFKEPYNYELKELSYVWSAAMFEGKVDKEDPTIQIKDIIKNNTNTWTVKLTNNKTIKLQIQGSGFLENHNAVFRSCDHKVDDLSYFLNQELDCVRDKCGYEPYINKKENIWIFIDDLKYRFGTEECKKTINPEFYKHLKKKPQQGIIEQIEYSQTKTQRNAYQFCKRRGTVRGGDMPEGNRICGKRGKASVSSRPLGYREVIGD